MSGQGTGASDGAGADEDVSAGAEGLDGADGADGADGVEGADRAEGADGVDRAALAPSGARTPGTGQLVLVGTPIGNLGDLSPRAVRTLAEADVIYCEDTRHSRKLLSHSGISGVPLRSLHEHNERDRIDEVVAAVAGGSTVALVTDAGMPGVSDPGSRVTAAVASAGLAVSVVPGPSAALAALVASGLPTDRFVFEGFLPRSGRGRTERLADVAAEGRTVVLFEAPGRVGTTLADLARVCGDERPVVVARELTKVHEEVWRGTLEEGVAWATGSGVRGEVVLVLAGAPEAEDSEVDDAALVAAVRGRLAAGERTRGAVDGVAAQFGVSRRRVYALAIAARPPAEPGNDRS